MLVRDWMHKNIITIEVDDSMQDAIGRLKEHNIRMLPVMKKGKLVGIITDRDLKEASASDATTLEIYELLYLISKIKISEIMSKNPITVPLDYTLEETAEILLKKKISGAPVLDHEGNIVGTITQTDLFKALISLTALANRGIQFAFQLENKPGSIKKAADIVRKYGGRIANILSTFDQAPEGYRLVYVRAYDIDRSRLHELKEELKEKTRLLYIVDHRENKREIYDR